MVSLMLLKSLLLNPSTSFSCLYGPFLPDTLLSHDLDDFSFECFLGYQFHLPYGISVLYRFQKDLVWTESMSLFFTCFHSAEPPILCFRFPCGELLGLFYFGEFHSIRIASSKSWLTILTTVQSSFVAAFYQMLEFQYLGSWMGKDFLGSSSFWLLFWDSKSGMLKFQSLLLVQDFDFFSFIPSLQFEGEAFLLESYPFFPSNTSIAFHLICT